MPHTIEIVVSSDIQFAERRLNEIKWNNGIIPDKNSNAFCDTEENPDKDSNDRNDEELSRRKFSKTMTV